MDVEWEDGDVSRRSQFEASSTAVEALKATQQLKLITNIHSQAI